MLKTYNKEELLALGTKRFQVSETGDIDAIMSLFVEQPIFDLHPIGLRLSGQVDVRRYYTYMCSEVAPLISAEPVGSFLSDCALAFELKLTHQPPAGNAQSFRLLSIMEVVDDRFTGERLYGDERLFRILFGGPIWSLMTPIEA